MRNANILVADYCKHRVLKECCAYCSDSWSEIFVEGMQYYCSMHNDLKTLNTFESLSEKSNIRAFRDCEFYVDAEYQYILRVLNGIELYSFKTLYMLAETIGRQLLDIIYIQEAMHGKHKRRHLHLRLKYLKRK